MIDTENGHPDMDYTEHKRTYEGFLQATTIGVVSLIVLLILMAFFLL